MSADDTRLCRRAACAVRDLLTLRGLKATGLGVVTPGSTFVRARAGYYNDGSERYHHVEVTFDSRRVSTVLVEEVLDAAGLDYLCVDSVNSVTMILVEPPRGTQRAVA